MRVAAVSLLLALAASTASAQFGETIEVRVSNVNVVVTDRAGKPVAGLTKDDFEVLENGFQRPITNFYELRGGDDAQATPATTPQPPEAQQRRRLVVFIDQETVDPRRRTSALAALSARIDRLLRDGDEAMVLEYYRDRRVMTDLTSDRAAIHRALDAAAAGPAFGAQRQVARDRVLTHATEVIGFAKDNLKPLPGGALRQVFMTMEQAYTDAKATAKLHADEVFASQRRLLGVLFQTVSSMAGLEGKKVLLFVGAELRQRPGLDVLDDVDALFRQAGAHSVMGMSAGVRNDLGVELGKLAREANANEVTLYMIDGSDRTSRSSAASSAHIDGTERNNDGGIDLDSAVAMTSLASDTGGRALIGSINDALLVDNMTRDLTSYYSLGYKPDAGAGERTLAVKVKKPGLVVRTRRSTTLKSTDEETTDNLIANAFYPRSGGDIGVILETGIAQADGDHFLLPVTVHVRGDITAIPSGDTMSGQFEVYFVTAAPRGNLSPVARDIQTFSYPIRDAKTGMQRITYSGSLRVRSGEQLVSVAVVDRLAGRSGFARARFVTP
jgi:VWFA-related protein